jgi:hypothetical protein
LGPSLAEDNKDLFGYMAENLIKYSGAVASLSRNKKAASFGHEMWLRRSEFPGDTDRQCKSFISLR